MGNALGCAGFGERLAAAARDGDAAEARRLVAANPGLARCAAFGSLNSPLHLAAAKGHYKISALLLENGADVNARNIYGQTALMQACRFGHWEVVQTLIVFRCNVSKVDGLSSRTALHLAAAGGHVKCVRLLLAAAGHSDSFVNRPASGGVTALHLAALHGQVDCVHLLVDERADLAAQTLPCVASPMGSIGAGSTPLHYAAAGGEVKCCQILVSRGADRAAVNCNGWLPVDVARTWGCHWLEHVLSPKSHLPIPKFPPSAYLSTPLATVLSLARECGLVLSSPSPDDSDAVDEGDSCAVCLERPCNVAAEVCGHELCVKCALDLCSVIKSYDVPGIAGAIPCPLCRSGIASFRRRPAAEAEPEPDVNPACKNCSGGDGDHRASSGSGTEKRPADGCRSYGAAATMDSEAIVPLYCVTPSAVLS